MRTTAWLCLELREVRSYHKSEYTIHITKVRQSRPLNELAVKVVLDVPDEVIMPKAEALVQFEREISLELAAPDEEEG